jgi:arginase family enzyme
MVAFIDSDGCREYAEKVESFLRETILPGIPIMLGVDHSLTGGCVKALTREYDSVNLALIILDSHFDAIIPSVRCGLIQYDVETNPISPFSPSDPYVKGRLDSYNADSFIYYLVKERVLPPENILVLGVSDYPPPQPLRPKTQGLSGT